METEVTYEIQTLSPSGVWGNVAQALSLSEDCDAYRCDTLEDAQALRDHLVSCGYDFDSLQIVLVV